MDTDAFYRDELSWLPVDNDLGSPLEVVPQQLKEVTVDALRTEFFQQASVSHPVEGSRYIWGDHDSVQTVKGVLPVTSEEHQ